MTIDISGKNSTEIAATEARVVEELEAFRTEKFMYFLFINALWMIVTSIILLYTDSLISIDIEIPRGKIHSPIHNTLPLTCKMLERVTGDATKTVL